MLMFLLQISLLDTEGIEEHGSYMFLLQLCAAGASALIGRNLRVF